MHALIQNEKILSDLGRKTRPLLACPCSIEVIGDRDGQDVNFIEFTHKNVTIHLSGNIILTEYNEGQNSFEPTSFIELYLNCGISAFDYLDGQYALALFDHSNGKLYLTRDPFGTIPLYRARLGETLAYSSCIKDLLTGSPTAVDFDYSSIEYFLKEGWVPPFSTYHKSILPVQPGYLEILTSNSENIIRLSPQPREYAFPTKKVDANDLLQILREAIRNSGPVKNKRIGVTLSGGVDSAGVVALLREAYPEQQIASFTVGYGADDPEIRGARATAEIFGTQHHELIMKPADIFELLEETVATLQNPGGYDEFVSLNALWRLAARHVDVLYSGNLSDTVFSGMPTHRRLWLHKTFGKLLPSWAGSPAAANNGYHHSADADSQPCTVVGPARSEKAFKHWLAHASSLFEALQLDLEAWDERIGAQTTLARHHGIDLRMPFAKKKIIDFCLKTRDNEKVNFFGCKRIFRRALARVLPYSLRSRRKGIQQLKYDNDMQKMMILLFEKYISEDNIKKRGILDLDSVLNVKESIQSKLTPTNFRFAWNVILFEIWCKIFIDDVHA